MSEPNTTAIVVAAHAAYAPSPIAVVTGTVASSATTLLLSPVIGQYAIILGMALLGTLVALAERDPVPTGSVFNTMWTAIKFIFRGVALSSAFCSMVTIAVIHALPDSYGITPYAALSTVAFSIGWTTDRWGAIKDGLISWITSKFSK